MARTIALILMAMLCAALPSRAQTTTVTQQPQPQAQPPPPGTTTTVTTQPQSPPATQPAQPGSSTQVVVNPPPAGTTTTASPPPSSSTVAVEPGTRVRVYDEPTVGVETRRGPSPVAIVATDALYGGLAGLAIGGGVALINNGDHWQRDLMIGAGAGILAGAVFGIVHAATTGPSSDVRRAAADRDPAATEHPTNLALGGSF